MVFGKLSTCPLTLGSLSDCIFILQFLGSPTKLEFLGILEEGSEVPEINPVLLLITPVILVGFESKSQVTPSPKGSFESIPASCTLRVLQMWRESSDMCLRAAALGKQDFRKLTFSYFLCIYSFIFTWDFSTTLIPSKTSFNVKWLLLSAGRKSVHTAWIAVCCDFCVGRISASRNKREDGWLQ